MTRKTRSFDPATYLDDEASMAAYPALLPLAGRIDVATVERLIEVQRRNIAAGTFFGAINFYAYLLKRPG